MPKSPSAGTSSVASTQGRIRPCVLAFAIEDRVEFAFDNSANKDEARVEFYEFSPTGYNGDFFANVRQLIRDSIHSLFQASIYDEPFELIDSIASIVISSPGLIKGNRVLIQLPLWSWDNTTIKPHIVWKWKDSVKTYFDFAAELLDIFDEAVDGRLTDDRRDHIQSRIFAVNDATAGAVFEYSSRCHSKSTSGSALDQADFVYIKLHNGVNAGVVEGSLDDKVSIRTNNPEAGHFYPIDHHLDIDSNFQGVCPYHSGCLEGMISAHAFYTRAISPEFALHDEWLPELNRCQNLPGSYPDKAKSQFSGYIASSSFDGIDMIAWYLAQLLHRLAIGTLAPAGIVLAGRLAKPLVVQATRRRLLGLIRGYPQRDHLLEPGIHNFIVGSVGSEHETERELLGARNLAWDRAGLPIGKQTRPRSTPLTPRSAKVIPLHSASK